MRGDEFTFGETLGKIKECKSTDWTSEVVNNTTMVTHTCTVKLDEAIFTKSKERSLRDLEEVAALEARYHQENLAKIQAWNARTSSPDERSLARVQQKLEMLAAEDAQLDAPFVYRRSFAADTEDQARARWEGEKARRRENLTQEKQNALHDIEIIKDSKQRESEQSAATFQAVQPWIEKYPAAIAETKAKIAKEIDANYDKSHTTEVKTVFRYREGIDAELVDAALVIDGSKRRATIPLYIIDPTRMQEFLNYMSKDGFGMDVRGRFNEEFPIESDRTIGNDYDGRGYRYKQRKAGE